MKRRLFNLLVVLSILLCAGVVALWVLGLFTNIHVAYGRYFNGTEFYESFLINSMAGHIGFCIRRYNYVGVMASDQWAAVKKAGLLGWRIGVRRERHSFGFLWYLKVIPDYYATNTPFPWSYYSIDVPYWLFLLPSSVMPLIWLLDRRRYRRRMLARLCICGYDLRATPDRCPECGTLCGLTNEAG